MEKISSELIILLYFENNLVKWKMNGLDILILLNSEVGSFELLISIISVEGLWVWFEFGDVVIWKILIV